MKLIKVVQIAVALPALAVLLLLAGCNVEDAPLESVAPTNGPAGEPALTPRSTSRSDGGVEWIDLTGEQQGGGPTPDLSGSFLYPSSENAVNTRNNIRVRIDVGPDESSPGQGVGSSATIDQLYLIAVSDADESGDFVDEELNNGLRWQLCDGDDGCGFEEYRGWVSGVRIPNLSALVSLAGLFDPSASMNDAVPDHLVLGARVDGDYLALASQSLQFEQSPIEFSEGSGVGVDTQRTLTMNWETPAHPGSDGLNYVTRSFSVDDFVEDKGLFSGLDDSQPSELEDSIENDFVGFLDGLFRRQERIPGEQLSYTDQTSRSESRLYQVVGVNGHGIVAESDYVLTPAYLKIIDVDAFEYASYYPKKMAVYVGKEDISCSISWSTGATSDSCYSYYYGANDWPSGVGMLPLNACHAYPESSSETVTATVTLTDGYGGVREESIELDYSSDNCESGMAS